MGVEARGERTQTLVRSLVQGLSTRIERELRPGGFARKVAILVGGTALAQGLTVVASPLLTRLYNPTEFGLLAIFVSILAPLMTLSSWRYELALPLPEEDQVALSLLVLALTVLVGMTAVIALAVWLLGDLVTGWANAESLRPYLWLFPLTYLGAGAYQVLSTWAVRKHHFGQIARTSVNRSIWQVVSQVGLGVAGAGPIGLLLGFTVGRASGSVRLARLTWREHQAGLRRVSVVGVVRVAGRYRRFPLLSSGSALLATAGSQVPALLLSIFYGTSVVGLYALGQRVLAVPLDLLQGSIASVYFAESARVVKESPERLMAFFRATIRRLVLLGLPLVVAVALPAPWAFRLVFGAGWSEAGRYLQVLAAMFFCDFVNRPISGTFDVLERLDLELLWSVLRIGLIVGALVGAGVFDQGPFVSIVLLSAAGAISAVIGIILSWYAIHLAIKQEAA